MVLTTYRVYIDRRRKKDGVVSMKVIFKGTPHNLHRTNTGFEWPSRWRARPSHTEVCTRHVHRNVSDVGGDGVGVGGVIPRVEGRGRWSLLLSLSLSIFSILLVPLKFPWIHVVLVTSLSFHPPLYSMCFCGRLRGSRGNWWKRQRERKKEKVITINFHGEF